MDKEEMRGGENVKQVTGGTGWSDVEEESGGAFIFKKIKRKELTQKKKALSTQDEAGLAPGGVSSAARGTVGSPRRLGGLWLLLLRLLVLLLRIAGTI